MIPLLALGLLGCAHHPASTAAPAAPTTEAPAPPAWLSEVLPHLKANEWKAADEVLSRALDRQDLPLQERALALWYRASARSSAGDDAGEIEDLRAFVSTAALIHVAGDAAGAQIRHNVALAALAVAADDASRDPRVASDPEHAVSVLLAVDESLFVGRLRCGPDGRGSYDALSQELIDDERGVFDHLLLRCDADGGTRDAWFDLSEWWQLLSFSLGAGPPPDGLEPEGAKALMEIALPHGP